MRTVRVAVISDIHANLQALEAVLAKIDGDPPEQLWCLGDLVGYGPRPNECCRIVAARADLCLIGNHDLVALGSAGVGIEEFNPDAAAAARWTQQALSDESRAFLEGLEPATRRENVELYHGSPRDPVWEYVLSGEAAAAAFERTSAPLVLVGHSHVALAITLAGQAVSGGLTPDGTTLELSGARWLLNPGSVGQPRDGDPRAAYLTLDLADGAAVFHRVPYPIERTQTEIREAGLPPPLAARLAFGQ
jgi:diadenosine tetraphosphatase ApaH/serine/threonine PP2A family protein phosphatase